MYWGIHRISLLGLRRLRRNLLAMGPVPRPVGQRLLLSRMSGGSSRYTLKQKQNRIMASDWGPLPRPLNQRRLQSSAKCRPAMIVG